MSLDPLSLNISNLFNEASVAKIATERQQGGSFADVLTETFQAVEATDQADKTSALELLTGQTDDMSGLLLDAQKAEISLNLALQLRTKVLDAYNEIMRMQV